MEEWRDVVGYEGLYMVSSWGRVKSLNYRRTGKEGLISIHNDKDNYEIVRLYKNGKHKTKKVHRLVAEAFIPNPDNLPQVNHIIDDFEHRSDNRVDNLEWCTAEYNTNYGSRNKRAGEKISVSLKGKFAGSKNPKAKKVKCITTGEIFTTMKEAGEKYNVDYRYISDCCRGVKKTAGEMEWEYYEGDK